VTPRLVAIGGPRQGSKVEMSGGALSIGRKSDTALCPADLDISRRHGTIEIVSERFRLTGHDSQKGVWCARRIPSRRSRV